MLSVGHGDFDQFGYGDTWCLYHLHRATTHLRHLLLQLLQHQRNLDHWQQLQLSMKSYRKAVVTPAAAVAVSATVSARAEVMSRPTAAATVKAIYCNSNAGRSINRTSDVNGKDHDKREPDEGNKKLYSGNF